MLLKQGTNFWIVTVHAPRPTSGNPERRFQDGLAAGGGRHRARFPALSPRLRPVQQSNKLLGYPGKYYDAFSDSGKMYARLYTLETGKMVVPITVLTVNRQVLDALNHIVEAVVSSVRLAPLKASPIRNTLSWLTWWASGIPAWPAVGLITTDTTGAYAGSSTTAYSARYQVAGNGAFTYEMGGVWNSRPVQDKDVGTVELGGDLITLKGRNHTQTLPLHQFADGDRRLHGADASARPGGSRKGQCHNASAAVGARGEEMMTSRDR